MSDPIFKYFLIAFLALWCLLLCGLCHMKQTQAMFENLPEIRAELDEMEGKIEGFNNRISIIENSIDSKPVNFYSLIPVTR